MMIEKTVMKRDDCNKSKRCNICDIKTRLNYFKCPCDTNKIFCATHRYPHTHQCTFDWKDVLKRKLINQNPLIIPSKLTKI